MSKKKKLILGITTVFAVFYAGITIGAYIERSGATPTQEVSAVTSEAPEISVQGLLEATNAERAKVGVKPLILDERLNASAQMKLDDMIEHGYFAHENHDGTQGYRYIQDIFPQCTSGNENLHQLWEIGSTSTSTDIIESLMSSKGHREAILDPKSDYVGFAVNADFTVQHFCDIE